MNMSLLPEYAITCCSLFILKVYSLPSNFIQRMLNLLCYNHIMGNYSLHRLSTVIEKWYKNQFLAKYRSQKNIYPKKTTELIIFNYTSCLSILVSENGVRLCEDGQSHKYQFSVKISKLFPLSLVLLVVSSTWCKFCSLISKMNPIINEFKIFRECLFNINWYCYIKWSCEMWLSEDFMGVL